MNATRRLLYWLAAACLIVFNATASAQTPSAAAGASTPPRLILRGYDPVAYFTEQRPVQGLPEYEVVWDGGRYQFSSAKHRDLFRANPDRYAPQFAGYCSSSIGRGVKSEGDPTVWRISGGKLYVFGRQGPWVTDDAVLARSHAAWPAHR